MWRGLSFKIKLLVTLGAVAAILLLFVLFGLLVMAVVLSGLLVFALVSRWRREGKEVIEEGGRTTVRKLSDRSPIDPRPSKSLVDY